MLLGHGAEALFDGSVLATQSAVGRRKARGDRLDPLGQLLLDLRPVRDSRRQALMHGNVLGGEAAFGPRQGLGDVLESRGGGHAVGTEPLLGGAEVRGDGVEFFALRGAVGVEPVLCARQRAPQAFKLLPLAREDVVQALRLAAEGLHHAPVLGLHVLRRPSPALREAPLEADAGGRRLAADRFIRVAELGPRPQKVVREAVAPRAQPRGLGGELLRCGGAQVLHRGPPLLVTLVDALRRPAPATRDLGSQGCELRQQPHIEVFVGLREAVGDVEHLAVELRR
mmetsp:Transcript_124602/g.360412  ORF Transcript_124602/g.360412 Transcript_124602/m.360412 type:complete len:283 (+) Transcript_124602:1453-2301(+)